ncbi:MAG: hypothetical protein U1E87_03865 [Alphaproteobacteria bacterium]
MSFTLRLFLYLALIGAVGWIGFGYTSGYVAVPGDTLLRLRAGERNVVMFRKIDCEVALKAQVRTVTPEPPSRRRAPGQLKPDAASAAAATIRPCSHSAISSLARRAHRRPRGRRHARQLPPRRQGQGAHHDPRRRPDERARVRG